MIIYNLLLPYAHRESHTQYSKSVHQLQGIVKVHLITVNIVI